MCCKIWLSRSSRFFRTGYVSTNKDNENCGVSAIWVRKFCVKHKGEDVEPTYAAVAANISTLFAFVNNPTTAAKPLVKAATMPSLGPILSTK